MNSAGADKKGESGRQKVGETSADGKATARTTRTLLGSFEDRITEM